MNQELENLKKLVSNLEISLTEYQDATKGSKSFREVRQSCQEIKKSAQNLRVAILADFKKRISK